MVLRVSVRDLPLPPLTARSVHVKMLAFPINPADVNQIEGVYPISAHQLPDQPLRVGGNEGVAQVVATGTEAASAFKVGDWVLPARPAFGTWRTDIVADMEQVEKIPHEGITPLQAATLSVNPYFVNLQPGEVVLQNGANSAVGQAVIQIARAWGLRTMNVVRDRPDFEQLANELRTMGADLVVRDTEMRSDETRQWLNEASKTGPRLALNCVSGKSALNLARLLGQGGTIVTYGAMARQPLTLPASLFIFKDLIARGYWMSRWTEERVAGRSKDKKAMIHELINMLRNGQLMGPQAETTPWGGEVDTKASLLTFLTQIERAGTSMAGKKQVILVNSPSSTL
ncbi:hypothetical protein BDF19DRAFT_431305 [Syncephalis fuscata]|nr:hypothetical protein BDF19DRAFT_431305 [Syncephalis fuscata]